MSEYLDTIQAAAYVGLSKKTLEAWRLSGGGPQFVKLAGLRGRVKYPRAALDDFMNRHLVGSTTEAATRQN